MDTHHFALGFGVLEIELIAALLAALAGLVMLLLTGVRLRGRRRRHRPR